jgi:hypothetical protein
MLSNLATSVPDQAADRSALTDRTPLLEPEKQSDQFLGLIMMNQRLGEV